MHGIPVITTDVGDCSIFALDDALLVRPESVAELTSAMNHFAELSPSEKALLAERSRQRGLEKFDIRETAAAYEAIYANLPGNSLPAT